MTVLPHLLAYFVTSEVVAVSTDLVQGIVFLPDQLPSRVVLKLQILTTGVGLSEQFVLLAVLVTVLSPADVTMRGSSTKIIVCPRSREAVGIDFYRFAILAVVSILGRLTHRLGGTYEVAT